MKRVAARLLPLLGAAPLVAQDRAGAGLAAIAVASDPWFAGVGVQGVAPLGGLIRLSGLAALGRRGRETSGRGELSLQLAFDPGLRRGPTTWYAGGGIAGRFDARTEGFVLAAIGLEGRAGRGARWWVEAGIGGGGRLAAGYRWHRPERKSGRPPR
jgi:hypothetical protein